METGGRRYFAVVGDGEEEEEYVDIGLIRYFSQSTQVVEGKEFYGKGRLRFRYFVIDRGFQHLHLVPLGVMLEDNGTVWVAGHSIPDEVKRRKEQGEIRVILVRRFVLKYPKNKPQNMSENQLMAKLTKEAWVKVWADLQEDGYWCEDLELTTDSDLGIQREAHDNIWGMEQLNSSLDDCAAGICAHCPGEGRANVWAMKQLHSSLHDCVAVPPNSTHSRG